MDKKGNMKIIQLKPSEQALEFAQWMRRVRELEKQMFRSFLLTEDQIKRPNH